MIPKIIHYCWFGQREIPSTLQEYIRGWKILCPDWEIKLWSESNFDISSNIFTKSAYEQKKYAYVSDYVRVWALYKFGGVYLDVDVELKRPLNEFLNCQAFSCFEITNFCFTSAVWGSISKHSLNELLLNYYKEREYSDSEPPNTATINKFLIDKFHIDSSSNKNQIGNNGVNTVHIFASHYFCLDLPINYATHHFYGSWLDKKETISYKEVVHEDYYLKKISEYSYNRNLTKYLAAEISFKELIRLIYLYLKYRLKR